MRSRPTNCIGEAIENYLDLHRWQLERIEKGIRDVKAGRTYSTVQARARLAERAGKKATEAE